MSEFADLKNPFKVEKKIVPTDVADKIYEEYLQAVAEGKREGSIIGLGRKYFPGETKGSQQKAIQRLLREKSVRFVRNSRNFRALLNITFLETYSTRRFQLKQKLIISRKHSRSYLKTL